MKNTNEKGVTLIALVITIIVLLLIAGISIAMLSGENGILNKASQSAERTKRESAKERLKIELMAIKTEKLSNGQEANLKSLDENKEKLKEKNIEVAETGNPRDVELDGYKFKVNNDLTIDGDGINTGGTSTGGTGGSSGSGQVGSTTTINFYGGTIPSPFASGDGSETNPYIIENEVQLRFLALSVTYAENSYEGKYIKLNNDITLDSTKQWTTIGNDTTNFNGVFDGNGKTISGIYIENSLNNQGLFGIIGEYGTVKNTTVEGSIKTANKTGGIAGVNFGTISRCINKTTVTNNGSVITFGGIVGRNYGIVEESCNLAVITGYDSTGGIVGVNNGIIKKCYNTGKINGGGNSGFGGIAGYCGANSGIGYIYNSYNNAIVLGNRWVGGLVGNMGYDSGKGYIYNSYTVINTKIVDVLQNSSVTQNCYTTEANTKLNELNAGIDDESGTNTEQPWIADTTNINNGYPILSWQVTP